mgnify:CR=1 FL=1
MSEIEHLLQRLDALEARVAYQDQAIEALNATITAQWKDVDALSREIAALSERLRAEGFTTTLLCTQEWAEVVSSGAGEQSQLAISRAVLANPEVILMDEPTEGLSPIIVEEVGKIIRELVSDGVTVLLVEQNLHFALDMCTQLAVMSRGAIAYQEEVEGRSPEHFLTVFMGMGKGE